jgi:two-component system, NarL family, sensor histidine kinase UhpB
MPDNLPLRWRLSLLLGGVLAAGLLFGVALLTLQAGARIRAEADAATSLAQDFVEDALLRARAAQDPEAELARILEQARKFRHLRIYLEGAEPPTRVAAGAAPAWFASLLSPREKVIRIALEPPLRGALMIALDPADEIFEIWQEITGLAPGGALVAVVAFALLFGVVSHALAPVSALAESLKRLEQGERSVRAPNGASPELRVIADRINALATTLERLDEENHKLLQRMIEVQEDERKAIARDLHDEIGPFLFSIRAGVGALARKSASGECEADCARIDAQIASLQQVNRGILSRLRPAALEEMGLPEALRALAQGWRDSHPEIAIALRVDDCPLGEAAALAAYRVVQEGLTNAIRHSGARRVEIAVAREAGEFLRIGVRDDGRGLAPSWREGFGLRGMRERLAAQGGALTLANGARGGAELEARLPL